MSSAGIGVLHDFDNPYLSGKYALKRGLRLILYAISKKVPFLRRFVPDLYMDCYRYCLLLADLDNFVGLRSHFGLKQEVKNAFPSLEKELREKGFPVHLHRHFSKEHVTWEPPLDVENQAWFFDQEFNRTGKIPASLRWAVFHADYPYLLHAYVDFLKQAKTLTRAMS